MLPAILWAYNKQMEVNSSVYIAALLYFHKYNSRWQRLILQNPNTNKTKPWKSVDNLLG